MRPAPREAGSAGRFRHSNAPGERPGRGQSESLSCYAVYSPRVATTVEADRTCISNIHQGGTPPVEAAAVIVDLAKRMLEQKASGINMSR